jgi:hypothetical protein
MYNIVFFKNNLNGKVDYRVGGQALPSHSIPAFIISNGIATEICDEVHIQSALVSHSEALKDLGIDVSNLKVTANSMLNQNPQCPKCGTEIKGDACFGTCNECWKKGVKNGTIHYYGMC